MTTRDALETALIADPGNIATHAAYADYLIEQDDPRGEYIRLQLAAEDRNQPAAHLRQLENSASQLRQQCEREWLGELWQFLQRPASARSVAVPIEANVDLHWRRGWIDSIRITQLSPPLVHAIAVNPLCRLVESLSISQNTHQIESSSELTVMPVSD